MAFNLVGFMELLALILFLAIYALKPHEWPGLGWIITFKPVQVAMLIGILALWMRDRKPRLRDFFRTPHDWIVTAYFCWIIYCSSAWWEMFKNIQVHIVTYAVVLLVCRNLRYMRIFLTVWAGILMFIAFLAVGSTIGIDPLGSKDIADWRMKGRIVVNLSIYNNPNALAHTLVPVIPMLFFLLFWKRLLGKIWGVLFLVPLYAIYLTVSKGAFLSSFVTIVATITFGRPKWVQVALVALAVSVGTGALWALPRMDELKNSKTEGGIQGRVAALKFGLRAMRAEPTGIGPGRFAYEFLREHHYMKAAHNAYVQNGAEMGRIGLWFFVALMYVAGRGLIAMRTANDEEERLRRIVFVMIVSFACSSWMVDWAYRPPFFMIIAMAAALHRHASGVNARIDKEMDLEESTGHLPPWQRATLEKTALGEQAAPEPDAPKPEKEPPVPGWLAARPATIQELADAKVAEELARPAVAYSTWKRFGILDLAAITALTYGVERMWSYLIVRM